MKTQNLDDLREMLSHRESVIRELAEIQTAKRRIEDDITKTVFDQEMFHCLTVNWTRLNRSL